MKHLVEIGNGALNRVIGISVSSANLSELQIKTTVVIPKKVTQFGRNLKQVNVIKLHRGKKVKPPY